MYKVETAAGPKKATRAQLVHWLLIHFNIKAGTRGRLPALALPLVAKIDGRKLRKAASLAQLELFKPETARSAFSLLQTLSRKKKGPADRKSLIRKNNSGKF